MIQKTKMRELDPNIRKRNFEEVAIGYTEEEAIQEAKRCIQCKNPRCVSGCPVNVYIPEFISEVAKGNFEAAHLILLKQNSLPAICGRVCPQETQCEGKCVVGIRNEPVGIGRLERFVADYYMANVEEKIPEIEKNNIKVGVIGAGPAGLSCASELGKLGYDVTIFEALHVPGGVLLYGIPEFRLPKEIVKKEIANIEKLGVKIQKNVIVGRSITIDELKEDGYKAIFIGSGAGLPKFMNIEGEHLNGVYTANEFLTRVNLMKAYDPKKNPTPVKIGKNVAVLGGGNVAMDAARTAMRLGAENVYVVYRRSESELPARLEEIHHAKEEGIIFKFLTLPKKILGKDKWVVGMECQEMELGEPDEKGRRKPIETDRAFTLDVDTVIVAIGQSPNPLIRQTTPGLEVQSWGGIIVEEETMQTTKEDVYAGGDVVTGAATVILAMGAGKIAAKSIDAKLNKNK